MTEERRPRSERRSGDAPAFPNDQGLVKADRVGLSKREHFASLILAGLLGNSVLMGKSTGEELTYAAVHAADLLIEVLGKADREDA